MAALAHVPDTEHTELLAALFEDPVFFCRSVLPHWFPTPMPWLHRGVLAILLKRTDFLLNFGPERWRDQDGHWTKKDLKKIVKFFTYPVDPAKPDGARVPIFRVRYGPDGRKPVAIDLVISPYVNLILPRSSGKTTIVNASLLFQILFLLIRFFVYISNTLPHAKAQLATIMRELEMNQTILQLWGRQAPQQTEPQTWSETEMETLSGVLGVCRGRGSQIRGMNRFSIRPDLEILDDIEDDESVSTDDQLKKTKRWYVKTVEPSLDHISGNARLYNLGTIQHPDDISCTHELDPRYTTIKFGALDPDGNPIWALYMSREKYEATQAAYAARGALFEFGMEYGSSVRHEDKAKFKKKHIERYRWYEVEEFIERYPARALACDPALSPKKTGCFCAFAVVGMNDVGFFHIPEMHLQIGMPISDIIEKYFELSLRWKVNRHGFESVGFQAAIVHSIREWMMRKEHIFEIEEMYPGQDLRKYQRVEAIIQPRYAAQLITHNAPVPEYERQLFVWPNGKMDGPDVVSMAIALLDPYAGFALPADPVPNAKGERVIPALAEKTMPSQEDYYEFESCEVP